MSLQIWMILLIHSLLFMIPRQDRRLSHIFASFPCSLPTLPISTLPLLCLVLAFPSQFGRLTLQGTPANTLFIADLRARVHNRRCLPLHLSLAYTYSLRITDLSARVNDGLRTSLGTHWSSLTALDLAVVEGTFRARPAGDAWGTAESALGAYRSVFAAGKSTVIDGAFWARSAGNARRTADAALSWRS